MAAVAVLAVFLAIRCCRCFCDCSALSFCAAPVPAPAAATAGFPTAAAAGAAAAAAAAAPAGVENCVPTSTPLCVMIPNILPQTARPHPVHPLPLRLLAHPLHAGHSYSFMMRPPLTVLNAVLANR